MTKKSKIYPLAKIKRGDKGIGYTVFEEDRIKPFDVEILGLLENMLGPEKHVLLARLSGKEIEFTGVISGMSGSPVYIDGLLVGAVSYRFGMFSKEPIAGITPIESMIAVYDTEVEERPSQAGAVLLPSGNQGERLIPARTRGITAADFRERTALPAVRLPRVIPTVGPYDPRPIETPIVLAGLDPKVADELRATLNDAGFIAAAAGSAASTKKVPRDRAGKRSVHKNESTMSGLVRAAPIAPGAPIAAILMRGDIVIAATGTVTLVDGTEVLAFGHPFFGYGSVAFPMATASILNTLASPLGSYKMGAAALEVGSITHDRLTAIAGRLGEAAPMIPAHIRVSGFDPRRGEAATDTHVEMVDDPTWLPIMLESAIASAAAGRLSYEAGGTVDFDVTIKVGDRALSFSDSYSAEAPLRVSAFAARDVANTVALILNNNLVEAHLAEVDVALKVKRTIALATIEQVVPDRTVVAPGDKLQLTARIRPFKKDPVSVRLSVDIPADARGDVEVFVAGGIEMDRREGDVYGERFPETLDSLLGILAERRPARALYARTFAQRPGLRANADLLSSLPPSMRATLSGEPGRIYKGVTEVFGPASELPYPEIVVGSVSIPIAVLPDPSGS